MDGFALFSLNSNNLEKVVSKLRFKEYVGLQQTCRDMAEFIKNSPNITVSLEGNYSIRFDNRILVFLDWDILRGTSREIKGEELFATRLYSLTLPYNTDAFEALCDLFKKYRITCKQATVHNPSTLTKDQCVALFNILKPVEVNIRSVQSNRFEAVFQCKTVASVQVLVDLDTAIRATTDLLPAFPSLFIRSSAQTAQLPLLRRVLDVFLSQQWPHLRSFAFQVEWMAASEPSIEEVAKHMEGINWTPSAGHDPEDGISCQVQLPDHFPPPAYCSIIIEHIHAVTAILYYSH